MVVVREGKMLLVDRVSMWCAISNPPGHTEVHSRPRARANMWATTGAIMWQDIELPRCIPGRKSKGYVHHQNILHKKDRDFFDARRSSSANYFENGYNRGAIWSTNIIFEQSPRIKYENSDTRWKQPPVIAVS